MINRERLKIRLGSQTGFVSVEPSRVGNHFLGRQTRPDEVIAHGSRLIKLWRQVIAGDDDHLDKSGIIRAALQDQDEPPRMRTVFRLG